MFSLYEHFHCDSESFMNSMNALRRQQVANNLAGDFVVTAIPRAPRGACTFEEFEYMEDPSAVCS
jgi:hypothetical protein